jgi:regulator of nucleoside diphosphate kinase
MARAKLLVSETDFQRLSGLIDSVKRFFRRDQEHIGALEEELSRADVVAPEKLPASVVAMNRQVRLTDLDTGTQTVYTLSYPRDADISNNRISVLAPIGTAILGYRTGAIVRARVPGGRKRLKIEEVTSAAAPKEAA